MTIRKSLRDDSTETTDKPTSKAKSPKTTATKLKPTAAKPAVRVRRTLPKATARLEARISPKLHVEIKRAAEIEGRSVTDFIVTAVRNEAHQVIEKAEIVRLSVADSECFAQALLAPPEPNAALQRAFARRRRLLSE